MKTTSNEKLKIGFFTLLGLLVFVAAIFFIGAKKSLFNRTFLISSYFKNIGGLQVGNNVRFAGINVGVVDDIQIITDSTVKVTYRINESVEKFLKKDAVTAIGSDGLMGDKIVTMTAGHQGSPLLQEGDIIKSTPPLDFDKITKRFSLVAEKADSIITGVNQIVSQINQGKGSLGRLIYSDKLTKQIEGTMQTAKSTISSVKASSEGFTQNMTALKHNFLLRGYFNKKAKAKKDSLNIIRANKKSKRDSIKLFRNRKKEVRDSTKK